MDDDDVDDDDVDSGDDDDGCSGGGGKQRTCKATMFPACEHSGSKDFRAGRVSAPDAARWLAAAVWCEVVVVHLNTSTLVLTPQTTRGLTTAAGRTAAAETVDSEPPEEVEVVVEVEKPVVSAAASADPACCLFV